ncbi:MAG: hypothetical protein M0Z28_18280 [Rhodospirillales bacterium]|nr:hypothetical protein [Rhodospirillales bacterium]
MTDSLDQTPTTAHFNGLTPGEAERLALLMEECAEVQQVIGKILRHGYSRCHPNGGPDNRALLERELGDLDAARALLIKAHDITEHSIDLHARVKLGRVGEYLHHAE